MKRNFFTSTRGCALVAALLACAAAVPAHSQTGTPVPAFAPLDAAVTALLNKYGLPGVALAVAKDGRMVYARGFGIADVESREPVQPDTQFRVASVSKPVTAVAVLKLVQEGKISLDTRVLPFIGRQAPADPRYNDITVRHLLQHSGGLSIEFWGFDPSFPDRATLDSLGVALPPARSDVLGYVTQNLPLASAPGTQFAYSNIGYMFLTEAIEKATGRRYEEYMRREILAPLGIDRMRIAGSLLTDRQPGEARYWDRENVGLPIFPGLPNATPLPYGTFNIRIFESGGGWMASPPELLKFLAAFDGPGPNPILRPETVRLIAQRPSYVPADATSWYGLGWGIQQTPAGTGWGHSGDLQGTSAWIARGQSGVSVAVAANYLPANDVLLDFLNDVEAGLLGTALSIRDWPSGNQFPIFFADGAPRLAAAGVVNAASVRPGPVAAGSIVKLFGSDLAGGQVRINGTLVETLWTSAGQVHVRVPESAFGPSVFQVDQLGRSSNPITVQVQREAPGVFTVSPSGYAQAQAFNFDGTPNSQARPAARGAIVTLVATGVATPSVLIGGKAAEVVQVASPRGGIRTPAVLIVVRLAADTPSGNQPLVIRSSGGDSQGGVTLAVR